VASNQLEKVEQIKQEVERLRRQFNEAGGVIKKLKTDLKVSTTEEAKKKLEELEATRGELVEQLAAAIKEYHDTYDSSGLGNLA
jgi:archaellum component FlaC